MHDTTENLCMYGRQDKIIANYNYTCNLANISGVLLPDAPTMKTNPNVWLY